MPQAVQACHELIAWLIPQLDQFPRVRDSLLSPAPGGAGTLTGCLQVSNTDGLRHVNEGVWWSDTGDHPLKFTRGRKGDVIQPDRMWTDGGSIPRQFWVFKNYSPWSYGPAFVVHDWLFRMQDCQLPGYDKYDLKTAATVMSEVMKTLLEDPQFDYGDKTSMYLMYEAVQTEPARKAWEDHDCQPVPEAVERSLPDEVFHFSFGGARKTTHSEPMPALRGRLVRWPRAGQVGVMLWWGDWRQSGSAGTRRKDHRRNKQYPATLNTGMNFPPVLP